MVWCCKTSLSWKSILDSSWFSFLLDFRRYKSPFIAIQYAVDSAILQKQTGKNITTVAETRVSIFFVCFSKHRCFYPEILIKEPFKISEKSKKKKKKNVAAVVQV